MAGLNTRRDGDAIEQARIIQTAIRPTRAEVDLGALRDNLDALRRHLAATSPGQAPAIYAVIKADAYGHGALQVASTLEQAGADGLAVSLVEEGIELRRASHIPILVLGGCYGMAHRELLEYDLTPVVFDPADLEKFARAGGGVATPLPIHVKVDTGMSRLGLATAELSDFFTRAGRFGNIKVMGLCTHLACADAEDPAPTREQLARFGAAQSAAARTGIRPEVLHAANSAGAIRFPESRYDIVRPGIALFGDAASPRAALPGARPVLRLVSQILTMREVPAGTAVSYGGLWRASRPSRIATLPLGYADGYPRRLTGCGEVLVRGRRAPVVGAVCMDMFMVDVTDVPGATAGDEVVLLGEQGQERITAGDWASWAGTVNYEIYCGISKRVPRVYKA